MTGKVKIKQDIAKQVRDALKKSISLGEISIDEIPKIQVEVPKDESFGDFSVNTAMQLARSARMNPRKIAEIIIKNTDKGNLPIEDITVAGAGFINFKLNNTWLYNEVKTVLQLKENYGKIKKETPLKINVEYVSANPTGPLHIGNARGGAIGDVMANVLTWAGNDVTKEFYLNDAGNQILKFADSLNARYLQQLGNDIPFPEDGYKGNDIIDLVKLYLNEFGDDLSSLDEDKRKQKLVDFSLKHNCEKMKKDLENYGINYDVWFSESTLHSSGAITDAIEVMKKHNAIYEKDGALWFKATDFNCEKDEVLIRSNKVPTYYAADIAYHFNKFIKRKFDLAINVWGADHHGHVHRLKMAMQAGGITPDRLKVILMQLVHLVKGNEVVRLSKRKGEIYTLSDLVDEVGKDAARFIFNAYSPETHMDFDLDLAIEQSNENPVFYVQYAHARISSIIRNINDKYSTDNLELLKEKEEINLMKKIASFSEEILSAEKDLDPSKITRYATELSSAFHTFYNACRVKTDDIDLMKARLALVSATGQVLKNVLSILDIEAPEKM